MEHCTGGSEYHGECNEEPAVQQGALIDGHLTECLQRYVVLGCGSDRGREHDFIFIENIKTFTFRLSHIVNRSNSLTSVTDLE
jgi:hypothetical protein